MGCVSSKQGKSELPPSGAEPSYGSIPAEHNIRTEQTAEPVTMVTEG